MNAQKSLLALALLVLALDQVRLLEDVNAPIHRFTVYLTMPTTITIITTITTTAGSWQGWKRPVPLLQPRPSWSAHHRALHQCRRANYYDSIL